jgi:hypothetical protein
MPHEWLLMFCSTVEREPVAMGKTRGHKGGSRADGMIEAISLSICISFERAILVPRAPKTCTFKLHHG